MRVSLTQLGSPALAGAGVRRVTVPLATAYRKSATSPSRVDENTMEPPSGLQEGSTSVVLPDAVSDRSCAGVAAVAVVSATSPASPNAVLTNVSPLASGAHVGLASSASTVPHPTVARRAPLPSAAAVHTLSAPLSGATNARCAPSGASAGWYAGPVSPTSRAS